MINCLCAFEINRNIEEMFRLNVIVYAMYVLHLSLHLYINAVVQTTLIVSLTFLFDQK